MFEEFDDILTIAEAANALKIGTSYAYLIVKSGKWLIQYIASKK